jgi:hypothetical protein
MNMPVKNVHTFTGKWEHAVQGTKEGGGACANLGPSHAPAQFVLDNLWGS